MSKVYEVNITLALQDFVEADSAEEAEQAFMELWNSGDEMLEEATVTVTEVEEQ